MSTPVPVANRTLAYWALESGLRPHELKIDRPRTVRAVHHSDGPGESTLCDVVGWSSEGGGTPCAAQAVTVEDSGAGTAMLVYGGDWGLRLTPHGGGEPTGEPYLLLADASLVVFEDR